jgi:L-ascorbate metabolism protein UlaG (beta-lactamase superfamily)
MTFIILWNVRPRPEALTQYELEREMDNHLPFTVQFLGNTNLLFDDGENAWMTDGFFTRPSASEVLFGEVEPNETLIRKCLEKAGIERLDMIVPVHSHFDHAMDAAVVADLIDAKLWGSTSTLNIGRGYGLEESQMMIPQWDSLYSIGKFKIQFVKSKHWQYPDEKQRKILLDNQIEEPLHTPASIFDYKEGDSYTILVEYDTLKLAVQGSAGFREGSIPKEFDVDILFLAIAGLEMMDVNYNDDYQKHLINPLKPEVLVPIHWDDFTTPLEDELKTTNLFLNWRLKSDLGQAFKEIELRNPYTSIKVLKPWEKYNILDVLE